MKRANPPPRPSFRTTIRKTRPGAVHRHRPAGAKLRRLATEHKLGLG